MEDNSLVPHKMREKSRDLIRLNDDTFAYFADRKIFDRGNVVGIFCGETQGFVLLDTEACVRLIRWLENRPYIVDGMEIYA